MRKVGQSKTTRTVLAVVVGLALLGGAFYGGRVYQNNVDQKLFTAYNPPQNGTGRGAAFRNGGGTGSFGGGQNSQISAALAVGTPPPATGSSSTPTTNSGNSGNSGQNNSSATGSSGTGASSGASASSSARPLTGQLASLTASKVTLQSFQGQQSLPLTAATRLYRVESASVHSLAVGQAVAVSPDRTDASAAASVTIAPSGGPFIAVRSFGGFGGGTGSGRAGGGSFGGGSGGTGGRTGGFGAGTGAGGGFRRAAPTTGTITGLGKGTLTLTMAQGATKTLKLTSSTAVYRAVEVTRSQFKAGTFVSVRTATTGGHQVATDVVASSTNGAIASIAS